MNAQARLSKILREGIPAPTFWRLFFVYCGISSLLFMRPLDTNFIFDEQEALLANPYLWGELPLHQVLHVDFWGRSPEHTIGSYRPVPNLLWRMFSWSFRFNTPWLLGILNLVTHALTGAFLVRAFVGSLALFGHADLANQPQLRTAPGVGVASEASADDQKTRPASLHVEGAWLLGTIFITSAVSCEAVSGVVGLSDLLVGLSAAISVWAIVCVQRTLPLLALIFGATFLGCLSKETMLALLLILPVLALSLASLGVRSRLRGVFRGVFVGLTFVIAQIAAALVRQQFFPTPHGLISTGWGSEIDAVVRWWASPTWPRDELNNPLLVTDASHRIATSAVIYLEQLAQFFFPLELSGDYSAPKQAIHDWDFWAFGGAALFCLSSCWAGLVLGNLLVRRRRRGLLLGFALAVVWVNSTFLPVSGALVALPTIRAERLFYSASLGASFFVFLVMIVLWRWRIHAGLFRPRTQKLAVLVVVGIFVGFQAIQARRHAFDYSNDLTFWRAESEGECPSAKSFLNLGVMLGARGDLDARLVMTERALQAVPEWPMGEIYLADTYCRRGEMMLAKPHYMKGLEAAPQSKSLTALSLQCIWDHGQFQSWSDDLRKIVARHPDTWLDYFLFEVEQRGLKNDGIPEMYRPRQYNRRIREHSAIRNTEITPDN